MNEYSSKILGTMKPKEFRQIVREAKWAQITKEACSNYVQANLAIVPKAYAFEFLLFCQRNPRPTALVDVTEPGSPEPINVAPGADLRTDLPKYRVYDHGKLIDEPTDVKDYWQKDLVAFLIGCSWSFDWALKASNIQFRMVGAYSSNIQCTPAGIFHGHMVVSARLFKSSHDAVRAIQISSRHLKSHGAPVHIGDPNIIGIKDLSDPDVFGDKDATIKESNEIVMFWGCGVTPQAIAMDAKVPLMITHAPGHMFVTDRLVEEMASL
jgi:uncharacterized protein YcsI (UPF0317 family)